MMALLMMAAACAISLLQAIQWGPPEIPLAPTNPRRPPLALRAVVSRTPGNSLLVIGSATNESHKTLRYWACFDWRGGFQLSAESLARYNATCDSAIAAAKVHGPLVRDVCERFETVLVFGPPPLKRFCLGPGESFLDTLVFDHIPSHLSRYPGALRVAGSLLLSPTPSLSRAIRMTDDALELSYPVP